MTGRLEDKVAIVTGGASGIGRAICQRFAREGAKVAVADRNIAGAEETLTLMNATPDNGIMVDVSISNAFQVERMVESVVTQFGRLDILINGAAILIRTPPLVDVDEVLWDLTMETNVKGVFLCCKYAIPAMINNGGGSIVNISSLSGLRGVGYSVPYAVSKARSDSPDRRCGGPVHIPGECGSTASPPVAWTHLRCGAARPARRFLTTGTKVIRWVALGVPMR